MRFFDGIPFDMQTEACDYLLINELLDFSVVNREFLTVTTSALFLKNRPDVIEVRKKLWPRLVRLNSLEERKLKRSCINCLEASYFGFNDKLRIALLFLPEDWRFFQTDSVLTCLNDESLSLKEKEMLRLLLKDVNQKERVRIQEENSASEEMQKIVSSVAARTMDGRDVYAKIWNLIKTVPAEDLLAIAGVMVSTHMQLHLGSLYELVDKLVAKTRPAQLSALRDIAKALLDEPHTFYRAAMLLICLARRIHIEDNVVLSILGNKLIFCGFDFKLFNAFIANVAPTQLWMIAEKSIQQLEFVKPCIQSDIINCLNTLAEKIEPQYLSFIAEKLRLKLDKCCEAGNFTVLNAIVRVLATVHNRNSKLDAQSTLLKVLYTIIRLRVTDDELGIKSPIINSLKQLVNKLDDKFLLSLNEILLENLNDKGLASLYRVMISILGVVAKKIEASQLSTIETVLLAMLDGQNRKNQYVAIEALGNLVENLAYNEFTLIKERLLQSLEGASLHRYLAIVALSKLVKRVVEAEKISIIERLRPFVELRDLDALYGDYILAALSAFAQLSEYISKDKRSIITDTLVSKLGRNTHDIDVDTLLVLEPVIKKTKLTKSSISQLLTLTEEFILSISESSFFEASGLTVLVRMMVKIVPVDLINLLLAQLSHENIAIQEAIFKQLDFLIGRINLSQQLDIIAKAVLPKLNAPKYVIRELAANFLTKLVIVAAQKGIDLSSFDSNMQQILICPFSIGMKVMLEVADLIAEEKSPKNSLATIKPNSI